MALQVQRVSIWLTFHYLILDAVSLLYKQESMRLIYFVVVVVLRLSSTFIFCSVRPWDPMTDLKEYENDGIIKTQYRLKAPMVRTTSLLSVQPDNKKPISKRKRPSSGRSRCGGQAKGSRRSSIDHSGASTPDPEAEHSSSIEDDDDDSSVKEGIDLAALEKAFQPLKDLQKECVQQMRAIRSDLRRHYSSHQDDLATLQFKDWLLLLMFIITQGFFHWYYRWSCLAT